VDEDPLHFSAVECGPLAELKERIAFLENLVDEQHRRIKQLEQIQGGILQRL
jgi:hypothetical protein